MKKKKKFFIFGGIALVVVIAIVICTIAFSRNKKNNSDSSSKGESGSESVITELTDTSDPNGISAEKITDDGTGLKPVIEDEDAVKKSETTGERQGQAVNAVQEKRNTDVGETAKNHNYDDYEKYNCGVPGHHCDGPETHAYVQNLEIEGCQYCGSHSCPSFYSLDQWGNTCYNPSKCPCYDITKDPVYYCQSCGKKCGDGTNGTCVQFVKSCNCPNCGQHVDAWTCHHCN